MTADNFHFQEPYQEALFEKMHQVLSDGLALMYRDACRLMVGGSDLVSASHLVAHLLREINGAIVSSMLPIEWQSEKCPSCNREKDGAYKAKIDTILGMEGYRWSDAGQMRELWASLEALHKFVHRDSLSPPRPVGKDLEEAFRRAELVFSIAVNTLEASFPAVQRKLDRLLNKRQPAQRDVTVLKTRVPNSRVVLRRFFDRAGPEWLDPLHEKHFFDHPPEAVHNQERGLIYLPVWPHSAYLKRMAATDKAPVVRGIIKSLRRTNNARILDDFGEAMLAMPPEIAVELVDDAIEWLRADGLIHLPETLGQIVAKLAAGGEAIRAVELARALLAVSEGLDARSATKTRGLWGQLNEYQYEKVLKEHIPSLVHHAGITAFEMLCDLLGTVLHGSYPGHVVDGDFDDESHYWQDKIEDDYDHHNRDLKVLLTVAVRHAAEQLLRNGTSVADLVDVLESRKWVVFRRIALHILRLSPEPAVDLISSRLADRHLFEDTYILNFGIAREYGLLLERWYPILSAHQKTEILSWIEQGPDIDQYATNFRGNSGKRPPKTTVSGFAERWQMRRLSLIKDHLPEDWQKRYEVLYRKHHKDESDTTSGAPWVRPRPTLTADRMKAMDIRDLLEELESWTPVGPFDSYDDIAHELTLAAAAEPKRFSDTANEFSGLRLLYVWALLHGLRNALKNGSAIRWKPVLRLCDCMLGKALPYPGASGEEEEHDSVWIRKSIIELIRAGIDSDQGKLPISLRSAVWSLIERLADEPDLPDEGRRQAELSVHDLQYAVLNSVRTQALWTAVDYGIWLTRWYASKCPKDKVGLEAMPEVRQLLERHLDRQQEQSIIVHSVYGLLLYRLLWLDEGWTMQHVDDIFPTEPQYYNLFSAAWKLYVTGRNIYDNAFALLRPKYLYAVENMTIVGEERWYPGNPNSELVMHVLLLYRHGRISLDTKSGLLAQVFSKMPDEWRGRALAFVGETISTEDAPIEVLNRLQRLWEWQHSECKQGQPGHIHDHEMASFGWWWISEKFPDEWALGCLESVLSTVHWAEPDHNVVAKLAEMAKSDSYRAVRLLAEMCKGLQSRIIYRYVPWVKHAREIIIAARDSGDEEARRIASELVSWLHFWDYGGFNDLLESPP